MGESEKLVAELFKMAKESTPSIVFIDEVRIAGGWVRVTAWHGLATMDLHGLAMCGWTAVSGKSQLLTSSRMSRCAG